MASPKQIELFRKLTEDRDFGGHDTGALRTQFGSLTDSNASQWIERALERPKVADGEAGPQIAPPF
jgi:hypothetical protein